MISPLLANIYLHWFDEVFHRPGGPAQWANAKLIRYADDFVVMARYQSEKLIEFIESKLEGWLRLEINREKTRVVKLNEKGASLDFLGFTFRYDRDLKGRNLRYLNIVPSKKAILRERETLRKMTGNEMCFKPIPSLIGEMKPASQRMVKLLQVRISTKSVSNDELVCAREDDETSATSKPEAI